MTDCSFFVRRMGGTSVCSSAGKQTLAPPGAPRAQIPRTGISIGLSQQCGRPRPQQRVLQKAGAHTCSVSDFIFDMVDMIDMIDTIWTSRLPRIARRESGAATRAQRGSCHRTPNCVRPVLWAAFTPPGKQTRAPPGAPLEALAGCTPSVATALPPASMQPRAAIGRGGS